MAEREELRSVFEALDADSLPEQRLGQIPDRAALRGCKK